MTDSDNNASSGLYAAIGRYFKLLVEDTRLGLAEKLTRILSSIAVASILVVLVLCTLVFLSISIGLMLSTVMEPYWAFIIVAALYVLLIAVLVIFKRQLIVDPTARFLSSLIVEPPVKNNAGNDQSTPVS